MEITGKVHQRGVALLRIVVGTIFLWAGLEKILAPQAFDASGFLKFATAGTLGWPFVSGEIAEGTIFNPTQGVWLALADSSALMGGINLLVPYGQVAIGIALVLGLLTRLGAAMGALMMTFFFFAAWDFQYGIVNQHLAYALICLTIAGIGAGRYFGLDAVLAPKVPGGVRRWLMSGDTPETAEGSRQPAPATA